MQVRLLISLVGLLALVVAAVAAKEPATSVNDETDPLAPMAFSYTNCGAANDPTFVQFLQVAPDPVVLGKNVTVSAKGVLSQEISNTSGVTAELQIYKRILGVWVYIPCVGGVGSCTVTDICDRIHYKPGKGCVLDPWGIPCQCPFKAGTYSIPPPGVSVHLKNPGLSWLTDGDIKASVTLKDPKGNRMMCLEVVASLLSD